MSQCLILGSIDKNGKVLLLSPDESSSLGDKVS